MASGWWLVASCWRPVGGSQWMAAGDKLGPMGPKANSCGFGGALAGPLQQWQAASAVDSGRPVEWGGQLFACKSPAPAGRPLDVCGALFARTGHSTLLHDRRRTNCSTSGPQSANTPRGSHPNTRTASQLGSQTARHLSGRAAASSARSRFICRPG